LRPVTELSKNPFLPCFSIIYFTVPQLNFLGLHKFSFSHRLEYLNVASGSFPNLLITILEYTHSSQFIKLLKTLLISSASQLRPMCILPPLGDRFFGSWIGLYLHKPQSLPFSHPSDTKQPPLLWWTSLLPKSTTW